MINYRIVNVHVKYAKITTEARAWYRLKSGEDTWHRFQKLYVLSHMFDLVNTTWEHIGTCIWFLKIYLFVFVIFFSSPFWRVHDNTLYNNTSIWPVSLTIVYIVLDTTPYLFKFHFCLKDYRKWLQNNTLVKI